MITVHQQPPLFNYSLSIPDILLASDQDKIYTRLVEVGSTTLIEEQYDIPPSGEHLLIKLSGLLHAILESTPPSYDELLSIDDKVVKTFIFYYKDPDEDEESSFTFTVVKGYARRQPFDIEALFRDSWLSLVPPHAEVWYHQPLYLTTFPRVPVWAHVRARMADSTMKNITLSALEPNKIQSININPGMMIGKLGGEYEYFEVYTADGAHIQCPAKRFYLTAPHFNADTFFYLNRLGGWDTIVLTGERKLKNSNQVSMALMNDLQVEYNSKVGLEFSKTSGYIATEAYRRQCVDFINSSRRFHFHEGMLQPIVMTNPELEHTHGELNSFSFTFQHSDTKTAYPELFAVTNHINI